MLGFSADLSFILCCSIYSSYTDRLYSCIFVTFDGSISLSHAFCEDDGYIVI
jgi:hypothetical protein